MKAKSSQFFYAFERLFDFRAGLESLDPRGAPRALVFGSSERQGSERVGILSGSFNPPTEAHRELAARAVKSFRLDRLFLTVARVTVDKETAEGLCLEDRLFLLSRLVEKWDGAAVAAVNRGLYFEQVEAFRRRLGVRAQLFVIVGMDKVAQIFDGRYYKHRGRALNKLFSEAHLIVARRGAWGEADLRRLVSLPENRGYRDQVHFMKMPHGYRDLASSRLRNDLAMSRPSRKALPGVVRRFVRATGCYLPPVEREGEKVDRYGQRVALLEFLYRVRTTGRKETHTDIGALVRSACAEGGSAKALRSLLRSTKPG